MHQSSCSEPVPIYTWDIVGAECGVTSDQARAVGNLCLALQNAPPGSTGVVRRVTLSLTGLAIYTNSREVARAWRDRETGEVTCTRP